MFPFSGTPFVGILVTQTRPAKAPFFEKPVALTFDRKKIPPLGDLSRWSGLSAWEKWDDKFCGRRSDEVDKGCGRREKKTCCKTKALEDSETSKESLIEFTHYPVPLGVSLFRCSTDMSPRAMSTEKLMSWSWRRIQILKDPWEVHRLSVRESRFQILHNIRHNTYGWSQADLGT